MGYVTKYVTRVLVTPQIIPTLTKAPDGLYRVVVAALSDAPIPLVLINVIS